jgi:RNA polymerase sigma-70 factor (ECF subfamily)
MTAELASPLMDVSGKVSEAATRSTREVDPQIGFLRGREENDRFATLLGELLDEFRPYLLTIADEEIPGPLGPKLGRSDLVQDTLLKGYEKFATFSGNSRAELAGWLRRILLNHLQNKVEAFQAASRDVRREEQLPETVIDHSELTGSQLLLASEERERLDAALARLPPRMRQALLLRHRDELSFEGLGKALGLSETGARKLWVSAVCALQKELGEFQPACLP